MKISHPRPERGRQHALGIDFVDGIAHVDEIHPERLQALIQHGYEVEHQEFLTAEGPFEPLPPADDTVKVSKRRKSAR